jgi:hypothetical protein
VTGGRSQQVGWSLEPSLYCGTKESEITTTWHRGQMRTTVTENGWSLQRKKVQRRNQTSATQCPCSTWLAFDCLANSGCNVQLHCMIAWSRLGKAASLEAT